MVAAAKMKGSATIVNENLDEKIFFASRDIFIFLFLFLLHFRESIVTNNVKMSRSQMVFHAGLAPATASAVEAAATKAATTETSATEATSTKTAETLLAACGKAPAFSAVAEAAKWA
jgi:hypothetical protein